MDTGQNSTSKTDSRADTSSKTSSEHTTINTLGDLIKIKYDSDLGKLSDELRSNLSVNQTDLFAFCTEIKKKYGFWLTAHFKEDGSIQFSFDLSALVRNPHD